MAKFKLISLEKGSLEFNWEELQLIIDSLIEAGRMKSGTSQSPDLIEFENTEEYKFAARVYRQVVQAGVEDEDYNKIFEKELDR